MGEAGGAPFALYVDYGGMGSGFRYQVGFDERWMNCFRPAGATLEASYGFPVGIWAWPLASELDELAETMCDVITQVAKLHAMALAQQVG